MSTLTREEAIAQCKKLWSLVADYSARTKFEALDLLTKEDKMQFLKYPYKCPLCEYTGFRARLSDRAKIECCSECPYQQKYYSDYEWFASCEEEDLSWDVHPKKFAERIMKLE